MCIKERIKYSEKHVLNDVSNGHKHSIRYVLKKALNTVINMFYDVSNGNKYSIKYVLKKA